MPPSSLHGIWMLFEEVSTHRENLVQDVAQTYVYI